MDVELTDEQQFLKEAVAGVVAREATFGSVRAWAENEDLGAADLLAANQGWTGIGLEEELGGQGGGVIELAIVAEQLGRGAVPWDRTLAGCLALGLLSAAGSEEARDLAAATADGERTAVLCVDGRRPLAVASADAANDDDLSLEASYVLGGPGASELVVPVEAGGRIALFAISAAQSGVAIAPQRLVDRTRSLADVEITAASARPLGSVPRERFLATSAAAAVLVAADALGAADRLLELTTEYVVERRQFGVPVGSFQAVKHAAAEMLVAAEASRSAVQYAAWAVHAGAEDFDIYAAIAKAYASRAAVDMADQALFLHGAIAYTWEHDLQFLFKRAKSDELLFGAANDYLDLISDRLALVGGETPAPQPVG